MQGGEISSLTFSPKIPHTNCIITQYIFFMLVWFKNFPSHTLHNYLLHNFNFMPHHIAKSSSILVYRHRNSFFHALKYSFQAYKTDNNKEKVKMEKSIIFLLPFFLSTINGIRKIFTKVN